MKRNHWLLAVALPLLLLAGCGAKEPDPGAEAPTPTPAIQIEEPQSQVLHSTDSRSYYTQNTRYDLETMTARDWRPELPRGYQMTAEGPVSDGQALYFVLTRPGESSSKALGRVPLEGGEVQILYECGEHEQIGIAYTDGAGEYYKRPILLRNSRYNQHATTGSLLVEVGAAGNSPEEAALAGRLFARHMVEVLEARSK